MQTPGRKVLILLENGSYIADNRPQREARTLTAAGYNVSVICPHRKGGPFHETIEGVHVYSFPAPFVASGVLSYLYEYGYGMIAMFLLAVIVLIREGFDVVHAHSPPDTLFLLAAFFKFLGKQFVYDHRDLSPELYLTRFGQKQDLLYRSLLWFERCSCRLADCILTTNNSYREIEMSRGGAPASKIFVVRNGPDEQIHPVAPDPILRRRASTIIGYVGVIGPQDGVDCLLRALSHLIHDLKRPDFFCVLIGDGDALGELKRQAQLLGLEEHVWFTGWILDRETLLRYLSTADICVQPDPSNPLNDKSTMIKLMEYMALGKPAVAFDLPETRYTGGDTVLYAQPNDELDFARKIAQLMDDAELRHRLGQLGRQRIREAGFTWEHAAGNLLQAYASLELESSEG